MRVLLVTHHAPPHIGGVENLAEMEARALAAAGHEVVWVASRSGGKGNTQPLPEAVRLVQVPAWHVFERWGEIAYPLFSPSLLWTLWREVGRCDVLHAHGFVFLDSWLALLMGWLRNKRRILTDHGGLLRYRSRLATWTLRLGIETLGRSSARSAERLVAYNLRVQRLLERLAGTTEKSLFLPNPVNRDLFYPADEAQRQRIRAELGWEDERPKVVFVGRLVADKGIDCLLEAADPAFDLVFCGPASGASIERLKQHDAEYLPPRSQSELADLYRAADVLALPSWNEGFPVVIQEALACGLPVVTTEDEGYQPYAGLPGLGFCAATAGAFRETLLQVLGDRPCVESGPSEILPDPADWLGRLYAGMLSAQPTSLTEQAPVR